MAPGVKATSTNIPGHMTWKTQCSWPPPQLEPRAAKRTKMENSDPRKLYLGDTAGLFYELGGSFCGCP